MELLGFGEQKLPSVISDPFKKDGIERILVWTKKSFITGEMQSHGLVEFKNGKTKGEQEFSADTFDEVVLQIKAMLDSMDK